MTSTILLVFLIVCIILLLVALSSAIKSDLTNIEETHNLYKEATEWYNQLSVEKKAHIMDCMWENCHTPKNGERYMISIYQYYTQRKKKDETDD